ncbi:hypothetical protein [Neptunomonas japonica]|uniref:hypothetical protein n=1 Tax=Neptunomonas japonica TaxID=417574 RepID=UPI00048BD3CB|nr:hypothetical protein [Neptunomonas japonica]
MTPYDSFYGNDADLYCVIHDLKLVLAKTEDMNFSDSDLVADVFPDITRKSFIVSLLITLDEQFKVYCEILKESTGQTLKWNELKGSALERFIMYSTKVCGFTGICDNSSRQLLSGLIEVRNCIIHNSSCLEGFSKRGVIESFSSKVDGVTIENGIVFLDVEACIYCADLILEFMSKAYSIALEHFIKERQ